MVGRKKQKIKNDNCPGIVQEIKQNNNLIKKLIIKEGKRIYYKIIGSQYI